MKQQKWTRRKGASPTMELLSLRKMTAGAAERYPRHPQVAVARSSFGDIPCLVVTPETPKANMVWFHGGGFRIGSPEVSAGFASHLAARAGVRVILPFYTFAPEHPFPCALLDGAAVLNALDGDLPVMLGGDSAGGNLAAVLARHNADDIAALVLLSPWLDLRLEAASYRTNREYDQLFSLDSAREAAALYLHGHDACDPDVSPVLADLDTMPASFIAAGAGEVLLDDSMEFARRLAAARRSVSLHILSTMRHVEAVLDPDSGDTQSVLDLACAFVDRQLT